MANKTNDRNLNITINNPKENEEEVVISLFTIISKIRKYFATWLVSAIVIGALAVGYAVLTTHIKKAPLEALVSFSYSGIEKGKDPNGRKFDINTIKNPAVIEKALDALGMDLTELENIRSCYREDSAAVCRFLYWLHRQVEDGTISNFTELDAAKKMDSLRAKISYFMGLSFGTLSA